MTTDTGKATALVTAAIGTGWIGWIGHPFALAFVVLFPAIWAKAPDRTTAAFASAGYFLAASRGLPVGVANFYQTDIWAGLSLWLAAASGFVLVHTALWTQSPGPQRALRYVAVMLIMAIPPFGIVGWAHPITAAGVLFPGWSWLGLVAMVLVLAGMTTSVAKHCAALAATAWMASVLSYEPMGEPSGWAGIDTDVGGSSVATQFVAPTSHVRLIDLVRSEPSDSIVVLPESAAGLWTPTVERLWISGVRDRTALVGAAVLQTEGYDNAMVAVAAGKASTLYRQRMPVPVAMWRPWNRLLGQPAGASASYFAQPVVALRGSRLAILICYEQLLIWPVLHSMANRPDVLVATGNGWWTGDTSIVAIQTSIVQSWARLFGVPLVRSFNVGKAR